MSAGTKSARPIVQIRGTFRSLTTEHPSDDRHPAVGNQVLARNERRILGG